jgi:hypothetical protein
MRPKTYLDAWQRWEYKHTTGLLLALLIFILLLNTSFMTTLFDVFSRLGYIGAFVAGIMFVSVFTAVPAVALLISFSELNPILIALVAALGSMIGDYIILKFIEDKVAYELKPIAFKFGVPQAIKYLQGKRSTLGLVRIVGALVIASPLPDEIGIGLLGIGKLNKISFLATCYILNALGIFVITLSARAIL